MLARLVIVIVLGQLLYWDLLMKATILFSYDAARRYVDRRVSFWAAKLFGFAHAAVGLKLRRVETDLSLPVRFILIANHQSLADIAALMATFPGSKLRFVAKRELRHGFPAVSQVLRIQRHALIDRHGKFHETMQEIELLGLRSRRKGWCPVIFPEGTRSRDGRVHTFHAGAVRRLAEATRFPLVAVAIDGGERVVRLSDFFGKRDLGYFRVRPVGVYPVAETKQQLKDQLADAQDRITRQVEAWQGR
ncbi:MAG: lysophospholipid acyltransferase family protein [Alkalispirochaetaceae bacterium]